MGHKLVFNGIDSSDYGIIISGAGTYATPERDITSLSVPGRNGDIHFDNGRYNNIQVTYECGISKGFESKYLPFMRQMLSAPIYSRLEDDYHLDEFRLGTFRAEMVPDVGTIMRSGKFELVFDCKPQRFLKAGERPLPQITSDASPLNLAIAEGYAYQIFSDAFKASVGIGLWPNRVMTVWDTSNYSGYKLVLHYSDDRVNMDEPVIGGDSNTDPTTTSGDIVSYGDKFDLYDNTVVVDIGGMDKYVFYETPAYYELFDSDDEFVGSLYPTTVTVFNPTPFPSKPLIKFHYSNNVNGPVCMVNGSPVSMEVYTYVLVNEEHVPTEDAYLDCDTMDLYSPMVGYKRPKNWNRWAYIPTEIMLESGTNVIMLNNSVDYIEITPRWWRL